MKYAVVIEKAEGNYSAYVPDLPGCIATGFTNLRLNLLNSEACSDASREVGYVCRVVALGFFDDYCVLHLEPRYLRPACFRILLCVPGARSSLGLPGTVTRPGLDGCLN